MAQDKDLKNPNVPPLRFPGFTDEWKRVKVSDLLDFYSTNSLSWDMLNYDGGEIKNLHYGLIHSGLPTLIEVGKDLLPYVNETSTPKKYTRCEEGDVVFADASEDTNEVGKVVEFINLNHESVISGLHTIHGRDKSDKTVVGFKGYAFSSMPFHHQIRRIAQGTKIYSISTKMFDEVYIGLPIKAEQAKIGRLLHLIDKRIASQNKIIENLQSLIKGLAVSLTTQDKPNVSIQNCLVCHSSTLQEGELVEVGKYPAFGACGIVGYTDVSMVSDGAVLIIKDGSGVGKVSYVSEECAVLGTLNYLTAKDGYDLRYLFYALMAFNFEPYKTGMAIPHIYFKDYGRTKIWCPNLLSQKRIATTLAAIEDKLKIESQLLVNLQAQKVYLLSQLFI